MEDERMVALREKLKEAQERKDWYATCMKCGEKVSGALGEITKHRCQDGE